MAAIITLRDVSFSYDGREHTLFEGLSLAIPAGQVTAILGPNGAGKTTLLHLMLGRLVPRRGSVLLAQRPHARYSRRELGRWMGLVLQSEAIPLNFTVLEYVLLGRAPYLHVLQLPGPEDVRIAEAALEEVGIAALRDRPVPSLSGGERQLAMLARALAQQPRVLLMDEPTAHLDLSNKGRVVAVMRGLVARGVTVIFTTHEPELAASVASFVVLMRGGQVLRSGPAAAMLTSESLSATYGLPLRVVEVEGRRIVLGACDVPQRCASPSPGVATPA